jgi:hypothetical protein
MTPQKTDNNIVKNLVECEGNKYPVADLRRMMARIFNELKENRHK